MTGLLSDQPSADDRLGFDHFATILADVIRATQPPFTVGVFGEWGSGKTTLMRMIRARLDAEAGVKTVWFNAWKYDGKEVIWNALIQSVFLEMRREAKDRGDTGFMDRLDDVAGRLALFAAKRLAPILTAGAVTGEDIEGVRSALKPFSAGDETFSFINDFEATFRDIVERYVGNDGRLVVFVDDLDRCLPENAVAVFEAIKLYLDEANVTFVLGVEPAVVRDGIRHRYRDNPALQGKEYLEKIVQLPFVMRGLENAAALSLLQPYVEAKVVDYADDADMLKLLQVGTEANPRRIKRFVNTLHVLRRIAEAGGRKLDVEVMRRLSLILLVQMRRPEFYESLARDPGLVADYNAAVEMPLEDREKEFSRKPALKIAHEDRLLRDLFQAARHLDCASEKMREWVRLAAGSDAADAR